MNTLEKREKRRLARLKKSQKNKERLEAEIDDLLEDEQALLDDGESIETEVKQADMGEMEMPLPATSFAELDALEIAQERAEAVHEVSCQAMDLVHNILYSFAMTPKQKTAAIKDVGDEFGKRVEKTVSEEMKMKAFDLDLLYKEATEATEKRHHPLMKRITDWFTKSDVEKNFPIIQEWHSSVIVEKAVDGVWRAVMIPSNNFIDWHGDIISAAAHQEYAEWVNKNMDAAPVFMTWHLPGSARKSPVDFVAYENGFLIMSAPLTDEEAAGLLRVQKETDIGMSHTSLALARDPDDTHVITKYRMVEVTDLPLNKAANPFTNLDLVTKEASMDTKTYLAKLLDSDEKAENFLKKIGFKQKELTEAEIPSKEKGEQPAGDPPAASDTTPKTEVLTIEQVIERVSKEFGMEELSAQMSELRATAEKVPVLESLVKELAASREDELAAMIQPPLQKSLSWMAARPSQKDSTLLKENDTQDAELKKSKPALGWLSEATGTQPVQV